MRVNRVSIRNVLGIEELEFAPGQVTVIEGSNASCKTSILEAIRAAVGGGHDATLLHNGAEQGEIVLVLEDGVEIQKTITGSDSTVAVVHPEFGAIKKPQTFIDKMYDALSVNPIQFLTKGRDRLKNLLEVLPLQVAEDEVRSLLPEPVDTAIKPGEIDFSKHGLVVLNTLDKRLRDDRTGVNRAAKEKQATAKQMREALPAAAFDETDWAKANANTQAKYLELQQSTLKRQEEIKAEATRQERMVDADKAAENNKISLDLAVSLAAAKAEAEAQIKAIETRLARETEAIQKRFADQLNAADQEFHQQYIQVAHNRDLVLDHLQAEYEPRHKELIEKLADSKAKAETQSQAKSTLEFIQRTESDVTELQQESELYTNALQGLETFKVQLLQSLPIKGLEIREGEIYLDGIHLDRVNKARQIQLAIEVAKLRAGKLGIVVVDDLEHLDPETFEAFAQEAAKSGLQFIVSRVSSGALRIKNAQAQVA